MIGFLKGTVILNDGETVILEVGGVGYRIFIPTSSAARFAEKHTPVCLYTHLRVRDNEVSLYGFDNMQQRILFEALLEVGGVGPKVALAALSSFTPDALALAITRDDVATLSSIPGVGKKTAQRMALELKGKMEPLSGDTGVTVSPRLQSPALNDAHDALEAMGFTSAEIRVALARVDDGQDASVIIAQALRELGGARS